MKNKRKPSSCGKCKHFKDNQCLVVGVEASYYDECSSCIFYWQPLKLSQKAFSLMKKKVDSKM